jgi:hypothetical protein
MIGTMEPNMKKENTMSYISMLECISMLANKDQSNIKKADSIRIRYKATSPR